MAELKIISETGMFHSACRCRWDDHIEWYGFKPIAHRSPEGPGFVDRSDRTVSMNHFISFDVDGDVLRAAVLRVSATYAQATYCVLVKDCVSFSADVARAVGLRVPLVNISPAGFIAILAVWNSYTAMD